ncbi:MAG: ABC transporter ATP-binding protein [Bacteroidia bacterium]|jgi:ABC-2 type transport system ATP-binding protein
MHIPLLEAKSVTKRYDNYTALNEVSVAVERGKILGLLGPNGAGKTSLIRIINQITAPDSGEVLFDGKPLSPEHIARIGYLPEERGLYRKMEVGEQCMYLAQLKGLAARDAKQKLRYWFEKFEIQGWWNKKVEELSKGMAQKVQFIVTILHEPELLIFDEPFTGFDPVNANLIRDEILELNRKGATLIFSTHRMETVETLCDNIVLIHKSRKILDGTLADIRKQFRTQTYRIEFTGNLVSFTNALWAGAELIEKKQVDAHCEVTLRLLGNNTINNLLSAVLPVCEIISVNEIIPSMNDVFINMVQSNNENATTWEK